MGVITEKEERKRGRLGWKEGEGGREGRWEGGRMGEREIGVERGRGEGKRERERRRGWRLTSLLYAPLEYDWWLLSKVTLATRQSTSMRHLLTPVCVGRMEEAKHELTLPCVAVIQGCVVYTYACMYTRMCVWEGGRRMALCLPR